MHIYIHFPTNSCDFSPPFSNSVSSPLPRLPPPRPRTNRRKMAQRAVHAVAPGCLRRFPWMAHFTLGKTGASGPVPERSPPNLHRAPPSSRAPASWDRFREGVLRVGAGRTRMNGGVLGAFGFEGGLMVKTLGGARGFWTAFLSLFHSEMYATLDFRF